jgi:hypothetical protein
MRSAGPLTRLGGVRGLDVLTNGTATPPMKPPWTDPGLPELFALLMLAALCFGFALTRDDLLFAAIFAAAIALTLIGAMRQLRWRACAF